MCNVYLEGTRAILDMAKCPYEFASPEFLNLHLKDLSTIESPITTIRYEEEIVIELSEEETKVLTEYAGIIRKMEEILLRADIYGLKQDPHYDSRREAIRKFYEYLFMDPLLAEKKLSDYKEPLPEKDIFTKGHSTFKSWVKGILKRFMETKLYKLVKQTGDLRKAFLSLTGLKSLYFVDSIILDVPKNAKPVKDPEGSYELQYGLKVQVYEIPGEDAYLYVQENPEIKGLAKDLKKMLASVIAEHMRDTFDDITDFNIAFNLKTREYRQFFIDQAIMRGIQITPPQALAMGREAASWLVGLGAYIENISLDKEHITDIYIDSENSPIYVEHSRFGLCHTLYRYNRELLENAFMNIIRTRPGKKFDDNNPIADVVLKRHMMRCHIQRPPATFEELQGALRLMKETPFTYPQYLYYKSFSPFFAGYDDVMVSLGSSEAVLGLKGVGKTAFTAAKITAIGTARRIIPIQDIEEIPVRAFRKRGFHIGAARVQSSELEAGAQRAGGELDLVSMANALLRMGDAALIINEVRSRTAVQGIINLLNTQPGVFLLYNLHAESLRDIQDRLELVFGIPAASMFATDRYTFLKKIKFGRKGIIHRVLGYEYESDISEKRFVEVFRFRRGNDIDDCIYEPKFLKNPEAVKRDFSTLNLSKLEKELDIKFLPPALIRRSEETGISPEQYILQAFFKGKVYDDIYRTSVKMDDKILRELDFVLKANTYANRLISSMEKETGEVDFKEVQKKWDQLFKDIVKEDIMQRETKAGEKTSKKKK
ncbi:Flp pilus assembly complex ATPase component TadA [Candidatus Micrarchaeota archaeon]|nr:Flp pilus assembly complex ATPase component TadA [Candidatus Micrarchaeota archaeon]